MPELCRRYHKLSSVVSLTAFFIITNDLARASKVESYQKCLINVNRLTIAEEKHVWVCMCTGDDGVTDVIGRVEQELQPSQLTMGHEQAILRCQRHNQRRLLDACRRGTERFQRVATPLVRKCVSARLNQTEKEMNQPFSFKKDACDAFFSRFVSPSTGGVWICSCPQQSEPGFSYTVPTGRAAFLTDSSPLGAVEEIGVLEACTEEARSRIAQSCLNTPGDFQLLTLQMLEVCCKRARVNTEQKFQCKTAVPDDVSPLKDPFLEEST